MRTRMFAVLALLLLVAPASSITLPSSCPAASTASLNCTQGTGMMLPASVAGFCSCSCGASSNSPQYDANGRSLNFQAASATCTPASCGSTFPTQCATAAYKSASWISTTDWNSGSSVTGPPGCNVATGDGCNIGPSTNPPGTICIGVTYNCTAAAMAGTGALFCDNGWNGATVTSFFGTSAADCLSLLATPNASSLVTNYVACSTNMCNTLAALTATSSGSRAAAIPASVGAALIALASLL